MRVLGTVADLLVPHRCTACGVVTAGPGLCPTCLPRLDALALEDLGARQLAAGVVAVAAYAYEGTARAAVLGVKAAGRFAGAPALGRLLRARLGLPDPALVTTTWVPGHRARVRGRGFDLPRALAGRGAVRLLVARGVRADQTALGVHSRRRNVRDAFRALGPVPSAVVLVDDVRTTGATATAAAGALRAAGARRVLVATFCATEPLS